MDIRTVIESDYDRIISVLDEWWGGRHMSDMLPRLFFKHFNDTSILMEETGEVVAFLIGFVSQSNSDQAYVHFVGIDPRYRKKGLGKELYKTFTDIVILKGCKTIHLVTSPVNKNSIGFHTHIGFNIVPGNDTIDGISIHRGYDGIGEDRVVFVKNLNG